MTKHTILYNALATAALLLIPLTAMQFTDQVLWNAADFVVAGVLLFGTSLALALVAKRVKRPVYRMAAGVAVLSALALVWVELAVGIFN